MNPFDLFKNKSNAEVYYHSFHSLFMKRHQNRDDFLLGNSQREKFIPILNKIITPYEKEKVRILDVGAGSGEIINLSLKDMNHLILSIEEPNTLLLKEYLKTINNSNNIFLDQVYNGLIQDFIYHSDGKNWIQKLPNQDVILAIHMIYHLTNFYTNEVINPELDLIEIISKLYEKLSIGGSLFIVYAEQLESMIGAVNYEYFANESLTYADNIKKIWNARKNLLRDRGIYGVLQAYYPDVRCICNSILTPSQIYADNEFELAIICLIGEMGTTDSRKFDVDKLYFSLEMISEKKTELSIRIEVEDELRKNMLTANQPQVICVIKKHHQIS